MAEKQALQKRLREMRQSLFPLFTAASAANDTQEMERLQAIAMRIDDLQAKLALIVLSDLATLVEDIRTDIDGGAGTTPVDLALENQALKDEIDAILRNSSEEDPVVEDEPVPSPQAPEVVVTAANPGILAAAPLVLTEAHLIALWKRSQFPIDGRGIIVFGLRGCRSVDFSGTSFDHGQEIILRDVNYQTMNCLLGQWRPGSGLAVFPGSTVPRRKLVEKGIEKSGQGVNQLGLGRYGNYVANWHKRSEGQNGHWALRQSCTITIQRTADDADFDNQDRWIATSGVGDNIHCAFGMGEGANLPDARFSSAGCQTIAGTVIKGTPDSEAGPWRKFIEPFQRQLGSQQSAEYVLFSGEEAMQMIRKQYRGKSVILRYGSKGTLVERLQVALNLIAGNNLKVDGDFGKSTFDSVIEFQTAEFGPTAPDGIIGNETASRLSVDLPEFNFDDAVSGGTGFIAGVPGQLRPHREIAFGKITKDLHGAKFNGEVLALSKRLNVDPDHLMAVMAFETGEKFKPDVENSAGSGATGLIQFTRKTAKVLGTTTAKLANMSAIEQLGFVEAYFRMAASGKKLKSLADVYMAVLFPKAVGKPESFVLFEQGSIAYTQNKGLDLSKDGRVVKAEAAKKVRDKLTLGLKENRFG